jgi:hypothetical protein
MQARCVIPPRSHRASSGAMGSGGSSTPPAPGRRSSSCPSLSLSDRQPSRSEKSRSHELRSGALPDRTPRTAGDEPCAYCDGHALGAPLRWSWAQNQVAQSELWYGGIALGEPQLFSLSGRSSVRGAREAVGYGHRGKAASGCRNHADCAGYPRGRSRRPHATHRLISGEREVSQCKPTRTHIRFDSQASSRRS